MEDINAALSRFPALEEAIVFGSRAKGNYRQGSDVDLALKGKEITYAITAQISDLLNEETRMPYRFDVINYHSITEPALLEHIDRVGVCIYPLEKASGEATIAV